MKVGVFRRDFSKEVTLEQRLQGNKYRSHDRIWKSVLRGKANMKVLGWESAALTCLRNSKEASVVGMEDDTK